MKALPSIWRSPLFIGACVIAVLIVVSVYVVGQFYFNDEYEIVPAERVTTPTPAPTSPGIKKERDSTPSLQTETDVVGSEETGEPIGDTVEQVVDSTTAVDSDIAVDEPAEKSDFPEIPEGYPEELAKAVVWKFFPNYQKGDMPEHEMMCRVLIKLWNQGDHNFVNGIYRSESQKVYPLYKDIIYVEWGEAQLSDGTTFKQPGVMLSGTKIDFNPVDYAKGVSQLPADIDFNPIDYMKELFELPDDVTFVEFKDAGIDPATFLADEEK